MLKARELEMQTMQSATNLIKIKGKIRKLHNNGRRELKAMEGSHL